jgi:zinc protease
VICRALAVMAAALVWCAGASANVQEYMLDNGLKLLVRQDRRAPVVVSQIWYRVGGSYEHDGITGISHALEHMMFKGTERYPAGEFSRIIALNGGRENAFTGPDYTAYFQTMEKSRLEVSFELEADRMRGLSLPPEEFAREIEVIKEERRLRTEDDPEAWLYEVAMATAFQTSPYRQPIVGWMADLEAMTVAALADWYRRWYAPDNAVLVVAGDVEPREVHALAVRHFAGLPAGNLEPPRARPEVPQVGIKRVVVRRPAEVPHLLMAWKTPSLKSALDGAVAGGEPIREWEPYALQVLAGILDGGSSARFATRLVRGREVAAGVSAGYRLTGRLDTVFLIDGTPAQGQDAASLEEAIRAELDDLRDNPVSDRELDRVKAQVVSRDVYQRDSMFYQALVLGLLESIGLSWKLADEYVDRIQAITAQQVQEVARRYFSDDGLTVAVLDPQPMDRRSAPRLPPEGHGHGR